MTVRQAFDDLAIHLAKKATLKDTPLHESTDALKACTAYYAMLSKSEKPPAEEPAPEDSGPSFDQLKQGIEEHANGGTASSVRARSRRN